MFQHVCAITLKEISIGHWTLGVSITITASELFSKQVTDTVSATMR